MIGAALTVLKNLPAVSWIKLALCVAIAGVVFTAGMTANGYIWESKYNSLRADLEKQRGDFYLDKAEAEKRLNSQWQLVYDMQAEYSVLNRKFYDDVKTKLDQVSANVDRIGVRIVRVCPAVPRTGSSPVNAPTPIVAPSAGTGADAVATDGLHRTVELDSGSGGDSEGYDIFPETTLLMKEAEENAIRCNGLIQLIDAAGKVASGQPSD